MNIRHTIYILEGNEIRVIFANNLKRIRRSRQESLFSLADKTGLTHNFISDMEKGKKWFSPDTLAKLSDALNVKVYQFFMSDEKTQMIPAVLDPYLDNISQSIRQVEEAVFEIKQNYPQEEKP